MTARYRDYASVAIAFSILVGSTGPAFAYIDPGTASIALQAVIAAIAGGAAFFGLYFQKIKTFFSKRSNDSKGAGNTK